MIAFACSRCSMKIQVKPEFAGRTSRCPTCKQPLTVPARTPTEAFMAGPIDGTPSSLDRAGVPSDVSLNHSSQKSMRELLARRTKKDGRYLIENEIARGGMGAVLRAVDCDIRREVAVKYLLDQTNVAKKARFVEEAQITGQLEHPNIVPIHELGVDGRQRLFFSMKMVKGRSLAQVLDELRQRPAAERDYSLPKLLTVLVGVCNALAYAHSRGVVHRDLKPANIMLGDFGEVYVMDWGLAKVVGREAADATVASMSLPPGAQVLTNRELEPDLTQEGSILGTPVYMPPEQAAGKLADVDQRSDVYALGAILYELLALQPPISREGGHMAILMRVMSGEIVPPEERAPQRARAGKVPKELAAVALKALARERSQRYPTVESFRHDIERYVEGRSVSAKADTTREMVWKLVKRNKVASAFTLLLAVTIVWSSWANFQARRQIEKARRDYQTQVEQSLPAFIEAARLYVDRKQLDKALAQLEIALTTDPQQADARLLKAQILIVRKEYAAAQAELDEYRKQAPNDADAAALAKLCPQGRPDDVKALNAFADVLRRQKADALVEQLYQQAGGTTAARKQLLAVYRARINQAWPGLGERLTLDEHSNFALNLLDAKQVTDLAPLKGIPLTRLDIPRNESIRDLGPLKGMPLTFLNLSGCSQIRDLSPLEGMPLTTLVLYLLPQLRDLRPLSGLPLQYLNLSHCLNLTDLSPLQGVPLNSLDLHAVPVRDLTPLHGMPLHYLKLEICSQIKDLAPLKGLPLRELLLHGAHQIKDLTPLEGMQLVSIYFMPQAITKGIEVLRQMKSLKTIAVFGATYTPEEFWKKYDAGGFSGKP